MQSWPTSLGVGCFESVEPPQDTDCFPSLLHCSLFLHKNVWPQGATDPFLIIWDHNLKALSTQLHCIINLLWNSNRQKKNHYKTSATKIIKITIPDDHRASMKPASPAKGCTVLLSFNIRHYQGAQIWTATWTLIKPRTCVFVTAERLHSILTSQRVKSLYFQPWNQSQTLVLSATWRQWVGTPQYGEQRGRLREQLPGGSKAAQELIRPEILNPCTVDCGLQRGTIVHSIRAKWRRMSLSFHPSA